MLGLDETDFHLLGVLRTFGRKGYVTSDSIVCRVYPYIAPGASPRYSPTEYLKLLHEVESRLYRLATFGMVEADVLDLDVGSFPCYRIAENGGPGATFFYPKIAICFFG